MKRLLTAFACLALLSPLAAAQPSGGGTFDPAKPLTSEPDTSGLARIKADPRLSTFYALIVQSDQQSLLQTEKLTLLAPVNAAFDALPPAKLENLRKPENMQALRKLIRYHALPAVVPAEQLTKASHVRTFMGKRLPVTNKNGSISIGPARLIQTDVACSNGLVHLLDTVLLPPDKNLFETIEHDTRCTTFVKLLRASALDAELTTQSRSLTLLVPTDAAFNRMNPGVLNELLDPARKDDLIKIVRRHIFVGSLNSASLGTLGSIPCLSGEKILFETKDGRPLINKASRLVQGDIEAANGVVHFVDDVVRFVPSGPTAPPVPDQPLPPVETPPTPAPASPR